MSELNVLERINKTNWETICMLNDYLEYLEQILDENNISYDIDYKKPDIEDMI